MNYRIGRICVSVDVPRTEKLYRTLEQHLRDGSAAINFARNTKLRGEALQNYFAPLGVDPFSFQDLQVEGINAQMQTVFYCGYYPLETENAKDILSVLRENTEKDILPDVIQTDFGYELSFENWNDLVAICFSAELPWLFSKPIEMSRYENQVRLPVLDLSETDI